MGHTPSKPAKPAIVIAKKPMSAEEVMSIMNRHPDVVQQYCKINEKKIEKYIVENFWEEDVERWLNAIRNRSPKEHLQVRKLDFLKKVNAEVHHTSLYESETLVIRRASEFNIDVYFGNRNFDQDRDDLSIAFGIGDDPKEANNTYISCFVTKEQREKTKWFCTLHARDDKAKKVTLRVNVPANAIIGRYKVSLNITSGVQDGRVNTRHDDASFIVLFNPFSKDDTVYMDNEKFRNEYVLNDSGLINVGAYRKGREVRMKSWDFAQFDEGVLDAVLLMMQKDTRMLNQPIKTLKKYNSPVFVSRVLSAMINCNDDAGVLEGNWGQTKEAYADGKSPSYWNNSADILLEWKNNGMSPVKYGQCWVFSGVLTTALRAIGIPARSITNFESAHDTDMNETIDSYFDIDNFEELDSNDAVWNFHVWNEGYFRRPDLPKGYDGWQVIDATPQEESAIINSAKGTLMQCGPAPVTAVKEGDINIGYDTPFVFSEVNADKVTWFVDKEGKVTGGSKNTRAVGVFIGTKAVGKYETENIISQYKYAEGSVEERNAFKKAYGFGTMDHSGAFVNERTLIESDYEINISEPEKGIIGEKLNYKIEVTNNSEKTDTVSVKIKASSKSHTGQIRARLTIEEQNIKINPGKTGSLDFVLSHDEYMNNLVDDSTINILAIVASSEGSIICTKEIDLSLEYPECVSVQLPESVLWGEESKFDFEFKNFFPIKLTKVDFDIKGRGLLTDSVQMTVNKPILPGEIFKVKDVKVSPKYGWRYIYANITCDSAEFKGIQHNFRIKVT